MENNSVAVIGQNNRVISLDNFPTANDAYEAYVDAIRFHTDTLPKNEKVTVIRFRWGKVMTVETIVGTH